VNDVPSFIKAADQSVGTLAGLLVTPANVTVSVRIHDSGGTLKGGVDTSGFQTFAIAITP
jgi:hypothetical protein